MLLKTFSLILAFSFTVSCPLQENLYPCTCEDSGDTRYIKCSHIDNDSDLLNAATSLKGMKNIYSFTIENSVLNYIPQNLFDGIKIVELEFLSSSIMAFTETDVAFKGLEDSLEILLATECSYMNSWDWSKLKDMKKLMKLDIVQGDMESIGRDVSEINSLNMKDIVFSHNKISHIYNYAFANFSELMHLSLSNNMIEEVKRSMLPNPANNLLLIDLGYNEIQQLPDDFFMNMPKLEVVSIPKNKILTLKEQVFKPVWGQLDGFQAMGNLIRCDCRMTWIFDVKMPQTMRAVCEHPADLKGKSLASLSSRDLWC